MKASKWWVFLVLFLLIPVISMLVGCQVPSAVQNAFPEGDLEDIDIAGTVAARVEQDQAADEEPDIEATVAFSVAATQAALQMNEPDSEPPPPDSGSGEEPTSLPPPPPLVDNNPELLLPFWDDFDDGLDPVWRVINGKPLVVEGRLTSANNELSMELGNTTLKHYTIELDIGGKDPSRCRGIRKVRFGFSPVLHYGFYWGGKGKWYTFEANDWEEISGSTDLDCGHFQIIVASNSYKIFINGQLAEDLIFEPAVGPLLVTLGEDSFIDNFSIVP